MWGKKLKGLEDYGLCRMYNTFTQIENEIQYFCQGIIICKFQIHSNRLPGIVKEK